MAISSCTVYKIEDEEITLTEIDNAIKENKESTDENKGLILKTIINISERTNDKLWGSAFYERPVKVSRLEGNKIISEYQKKTAQLDFIFFIGTPLHFLSFSGITASDMIGSKLNQSILNTLKKNDVILNCYFSPEIMENFLSNNPYTPLGCIWKVDIPGIKNAKLGGAEINIGPDFARYNQHGKKTSIEIRLHENNLRIELSACGSIKFWGVDDQEKLEFIKEKILPLLL